MERKNEGMLDKNGSEKNTFDKIYEVVRLIPKGSVASYGQVAALAGNYRWARVVGYALHVNPDPQHIPCHRVVTKEGNVSKAFAFGGGNRQIELLQAEGVGFKDGHVIMDRYQWVPAPRVRHTFEPVWDEHSRILILGTFPSVKSRENHFYYGHPRNRFWKVIAGITESPVPGTIEEKKALLLKNRIAVWDVIESCQINGSSDVSIRDVIVNDIPSILDRSGIARIYGNGAKACELYDRFLRERTGMEIKKLPSTSPANASFQLERLLEVWSEILR